MFVQGGDEDTRGNVESEETRGKGESGLIVGRLTTPHDLIVMPKRAGEAGRGVKRARCQPLHTTALCGPSREDACSMFVNRGLCASYENIRHNIFVTYDTIERSTNIRVIELTFVSVKMLLLLCTKLHF